MANGTDSTVTYMIVVLLALAEQVIAMVAGNAPVVSAWLVRLVMRRSARRGCGGDKASPGAAANVPRTITQRFWPDREGEGGPDTTRETPRDRLARKWRRSKASDPYPTITTGLRTTSEEALDPRSGVLEDAESGRRSDAWEMSGLVYSVAREDNVTPKPQ